MVNTDSTCGDRKTTSSICAAVFRDLVNKIRIGDLAISVSQLKSPAPKTEPVLSAGAFLGDALTELEGFLVVGEVVGTLLFFAEEEFKEFSPVELTDPDAFGN